MKANDNGPSQTEQIISGYRRGDSLSAISKKHSKSISTVRKILVDNEVRIRESYASSKKWGSNEVRF